MSNINRPRQLFWYVIRLSIYSKPIAKFARRYCCAVPNLFVGLAITLYFVLSPSPRFTTPPQIHRAWRLLALPFFLLASMMWYKGFKGFCPILFLRSSRQLRPWELQRLTDDSEAQTFVIQTTLSEKHDTSSSPSISNLHSRSPDARLQPSSAGVDSNGVPPSPISPVESQSEKSKARIAPFLECSTDFEVFPYPGPQSESNSLSVSSPQRHLHPRLPASSSRSSREYGRNGLDSDGDNHRASFRRPPIFGPSRVVEDERIRMVHWHLWWSLVRFGLVCTVTLGGIIVAVPSAH